MHDSSKKGVEDRSKINMHQPDHVQYWTRHLNISDGVLQKIVNKVGNAAAAVKKELDHAKGRDAAR